MPYIQVGNSPPDEPQICLGIATATLEGVLFDEQPLEFRCSHCSYTATTTIDDVVRLAEAHHAADHPTTNTSSSQEQPRPRTWYEPPEPYRNLVP